MPDRGDGVFSEPTDFLSDINCPECGTPFKAAPVWEFVLRQGRSTCGNCWQIFALKPGAKLDGVTARAWRGRGVAVINRLDVNARPQGHADHPCPGKLPVFVIPALP